VQLHKNADVVHTMPTMAAGFTDRVWAIQEVADIIP